MSEEPPKVVALRGGDVVTPPSEPVPDVIELCEMLLSEARDGKLRGLAVAATDGKASMLTTWRYDGASNLQMLALITLLAHRFERDEIES